MKYMIKKNLNKNNFSSTSIISHRTRNTTNTTLLSTYE